MTMQEVYQAVTLPLFVCCGVVGNAVVVWTYARTRDSANTASVLIITLASTELIYLLSALTVFTLPAKMQIFGKLMPFTFGALHTSRTISVWISVVLMVDRFTAVRFPIWRNERVNTRTITKTVIAVVATSFVYNATRFFELHPATYSFDNETNTTYMDHSVTTLRTNVWYTRIYLSWMYTIFIYVIPFVGIAILGFCTAYTLQQRARQRANAGARQSQSRSESQLLEVLNKSSTATSTKRNKKVRARDNSVTVMLVVEAICFLFCNTMPLNLNLLELFSSEYFNSNIFIDTLVPLSNTMALINAAFRLELYLVFGARFRKQFKETICRRQQETEIEENNQLLLRNRSAVSSRSSILQQHFPLWYRKTWSSSSQPYTSSTGQPYTSTSPTPHPPLQPGYKKKKVTCDDLEVTAV